MFGPMGWCSPKAWLAVSIPTDRLLRGGDGDWPGDIDVMGGPLSIDPSRLDSFLAEARSLVPSNTSDGWLHQLVWAIAESRQGVVWPPSLDFISAAEVRSSWYQADGTMKNAGLGASQMRRYGAKSRGLCRMGFDRVALMRFQVGEVAATPGVHPWIGAAARTTEPHDRMVREGAPEQDAPYGSIVVSMAPVGTRREQDAGATGVRFQNGGARNNMRSDPVARARRREIEAGLAPCFSEPIPARRPAVLLACRSSECRRLYWARTDISDVCPDCGNGSTFMQPRG